MTGRWSFLLKWHLSRDTLIFRGVILPNLSDGVRPHGGRRSIPMRWMRAWDASPCLPWSRWDKSPTSRSLRRRWWGGWWDWWLMRLMGRCLFHVQISETCWVGFFPIRVPNLQNSPYNSIFLDFHQEIIFWHSLPSPARHETGTSFLSCNLGSGCLVLYAPWTPTEDLGCRCQVSKQCFGTFLPTSSEPPGSRDKACRYR